MPTNQLSEADGIKAIIYLQAALGITETEEQARQGWAGMSTAQQKITMQMYQVMKEQEDEASPSAEGK